MTPPRVSIIIRARNEERWINACLKAVFSQTFRDFEVILVDNRSTDHTLAKARQFELKILTIDHYLPGKAINLGLSVATGSYIAILSAHCIPTTDTWLQTLVNDLDADTLGEVAGVYGRQEPLDYTHDLDKRDLSITFGLDKRVQIKDTFFHNANSLIRRSVLEQIPFDEAATNIEDRIWGKAVVGQGYKIIYEPDASVYHYHGIHQSGNLKRAHNIVKILETLHEKTPSFDHANTLGFNITAIIVASGEYALRDGKPLLAHTLQQARASQLVKDIAVASANPDTLQLAKQAGVIPIALENQALTPPGIEKILQYTLKKLETLGTYPDVIIYLSIEPPHRPAEIIDEMIRLLLTKGFDSVLPENPSTESSWVRKQQGITLLNENFLGLACVTYAEFIRKGSLIGNKIGIASELRDNP